VPDLLVQGSITVTGAAVVVVPFTTYELKARPGASPPSLNVTSQPTTPAWQPVWFTFLESTVVVVVELVHLSLAGALAPKTSVV
jgi:hypothetical protein